MGTTILISITMRLPNSIKKWLLQRKWLWERIEFYSGEIKYRHLIYGGKYTTYRGHEASLDDLIESVTRYL